MNILIVCDEGLNRSATIRGQLQYWGHDCLTVGLDRNLPRTVKELHEWADKVIITERKQQPRLEAIVRDYSPGGVHKLEYEKIELWDIGPDNYPRPYNSVLLQIVKKLVKEHPEIKN